MRSKAVAEAACVRRRARGTAFDNRIEHLWIRKVPQPLGEGYGTIRAENPVMHGVVPSCRTRPAGKQAEPRMMEVVPPRWLSTPSSRSGGDKSRQFGAIGYSHSRVLFILLSVANRSGEESSQEPHPQKLSHGNQSSFQDRYMRLKVYHYK